MINKTSLKKYSIFAFLVCDFNILFLQTDMSGMASTRLYLYGKLLKLALKNMKVPIIPVGNPQ